MALFDGLFSGGGGGLSVGAVTAELGYRHDKTGLREWDRSVDSARREARKGITTELKGDYDRRGFDSYNRSVDKAHRSNNVVARSTAFAAGGFRLFAYGAGAAGVALGTGFFYGAKKAIEASSDLNESVNASEAIFGKSGKAIQKWSKGTADHFGFARSEALQFASSIGAMLKPMGFSIDQASKMSVKMVELAGDMASFNNEDPSEMLERIRSGLAGESEPLRRFGVDLRVTAVEAFALNKGILEQGEKLEGSKFALAAYQKILADTGDQQGDFARTSSGLANVQRRLRANVIDLGAEMGDALRPAIQGVAGDLNDFVLGMKKGTGAGGDFRRFLEGAGKNVERFAKELEGILDDDSLSAEEKATKIFGKFASVAVDVIEEATPKIASAAAKAAPKAAAAFVQSFVATDAWGRLALGAVLLTKFGGLGAMRGAGGKGGSAFSEGLLGSILGSGAGGAAGKAGSAGRFGRIFSAASPLLKRAGWIGLGLTAGETFVEGIQYGVERKSDDVSEALGAIASHGGGLFGAGNRLLDEVDPFAETGEREGAEQLKNVWDAMLETRISMDRIVRREKQGILDNLDVTGEQYVQLQRMIKLLRKGEELGVGVDLHMDPKKLGQIQTELHRLKSGVFTSAEDIERSSRRLNAIIVDQFGSGTKEARKLTAQNMRATANAYGDAMRRSGKFTEDGLRKIKRLIRNADLIEGVDPDAFGKQFARAFGRAEQVTGQGLDRLIGQFRKMPEGARQAAFDAMNLQLRELRKGGRLSQREVQRIRSRVLSEFGLIKTKSVGSSFDMVQGVLRNFGSLGNGIAAGLDLIKQNTNEGLGAFNVDPIKWAVKKVANLLGIGGGGQRQARGGFLDGASRGDVVPVLAGKDEAFVTSHQQRPLEVALQTSAAMGVQPYPSLAALFSGETATHSTGPPVRRRARGGPAGPFQDRSDVLGSGPGFVPMMNYLNSIYGPIEVISGLRPGSITTSGNVSNHSWGGAVDISTSSIVGVTGPGSLAAAPAADVSRMDALHGFIGSHFSPILLDFLWRTFTGGNHYNHIHTGIDRAYSFDAARMMDFLSGLPNGGTFGALPRILLEGPEGRLKTFGQRQLDKVRKAADTWRGKQAGFGISAFPGDPHAVGGSPDENRFLAHQMMLERGHAWGPWNEGEWPPLNTLWTSESNFEIDADNPESAAYGIPQANPGSKMAASGSDWRTNPATQIDWGLGYIDDEYGAPSATPLGGYARGGFVRKAAGGGLASQIRGLYGKLFKQKRGSERRDEIEEKIHKLEARLTKKRGTHKKTKTKAIAKRGILSGWEKQIEDRQDLVRKIDDRVAGDEAIHGTTDPRDVDTILRQMGVKSDTELSKLTDEQKGLLLAAIGQDYAVEEREIADEISGNQEKLRGLLSLREALLGGLAQAEKRIETEERMAKAAKEAEERLEKEARQLEREIEDLKDKLERLNKAERPERRKGESQKAYEDRVDAWEKEQRRRRRELTDTIDRKGFSRRDKIEKAGIKRAAWKAHLGNVSSLGEFREESKETLEGVQGVGRTMKRGEPAGPSAAASPFSGEILDTQIRLSELGGTELVRPELDFTEESGSGAGDADAEARARMAEEELAKYKRLERVMAAQKPIFSATMGFPTFGRGGFAGAGAMLAPFVGSYRIGSQWIPRDGIAEVHRGEKIIREDRVHEVAGGGDTVVLLGGDLAPLVNLIDARIVDAFDNRSRRAKGAAKRPAAGVIARRTP